MIPPSTTQGSDYPMPLALTVFAAAYVLSGLAALSLPYETKGQPLADVVGELR
jgi:hypothetical protein